VANVRLLAVAGLAWASACAPAAKLDAAALRRRTVERLTASLGAAGYRVDAGGFGVFRLEDCAGLPTCYAANPTSPYLYYVVPPRPGEVRTEAAPLGGFRLDEDEALLYLGRTPPRARYFGERSYLFERDGVDLFASLGDTLNQLVLATDGGPFDGETAIITTADASLDARLRTLLDAAGAPRGIANSDLMPRSLLRMGLGADADLLTVLWRVALFDDAAAGEAWLASVPGVLLRIYPAASRAIDPSALPTLRPRGTGQSEAAFGPALDRLGQAIAARYAGRASTASTASAATQFGWDCIASGTRCLGDNRDAAYLVSAPLLLSADASDFVVVYGVDHERTGKASYINLTLYDQAHLAGAVAVVGDALVGSAGAYLGADDPAASVLYVHKFARACGGEPFCDEVPTDFPGLPLDGTGLFIERAYLEPPTRVGPAPDELEPPRLLHFTPR
jgi:hypothetical protein